MKKSARIVIVGGGIAGCPTLYHLVQEGLTDVILLERDELTSGSTWQAVAQVTQFGANQTMIALKRHSIDLYRKLSEDQDTQSTTTLPVECALRTLKIRLIATSISSAWQQVLALTWNSSAHQKWEIAIL